MQTSLFRGSPVLSWRRTVESELRAVGLSWSEARDVGQDRKAVVQAYEGPKHLWRALGQEQQQKLLYVLTMLLPSHSNNTV
jgi:hypothetical protein